MADGRTTVEAVLPRRTALRRAQVARGSSGAQLLAANVDVVAVVEALAPDLHPGRVERLLALAWDSGARPVVLLTKADLVPDACAVAQEAARLAPGCEVLPVAPQRRSGVDAVRALVQPAGERDGDRTMALVGASGAGKSTLLNALVGTAAARTQELRRDGRGKAHDGSPGAARAAWWRRRGH